MPAPRPRGRLTCVGEFAARGAAGRAFTVRAYRYLPCGRTRLTTACGRCVLKRDGAGEYELGASGLRLHTDDPAYQ